MSRWIVFCWLTVAPPVLFGLEPVVVRLNGVRQVEATIHDDGRAFEVTIRMLPVRVFDVATNARLNRDKAKAYALQALARHASPDRKPARMTLRGVEVIAVGQDGKFFNLTLRVPCEGLVFFPASPVSKSMSTDEVEAVAVRGRDQPIEEVTPSSSLLSRRGDLLATVEQLTNIFDGGLRVLDSTSFDSEQAFDFALVDLEEETASRFDRHELDVTKDQLLLTEERAEILRATQASRKHCLKQLQAIAKARDFNSQKDAP